MKLSDGEKLILLMVCDLQRRLEIKGGYDIDMIEKAIQRGHGWALDREIQWSGETPEEVVNEVYDVLDMWWMIERGTNALTGTDRDVVSAAFSGDDVRFPGFDGNNETEHLSVAEMLVKDMRLYSHFADRYLNSHSQRLDGYRRMLSKFKPMRRELGMRELAAAQIADLLNEQIHPENR